MHPSIRLSRLRRKQAEIQKIESVCNSVLQGTDSQVYLFGSYATNKFSALSDVDVLLVTENKKAARQCAAGLSGDTVIINPAEFEHRRKNNSFWKNLYQDREMILDYRK